MRYLKTNTATTITVGPFLDKTDGITPETAITVTGIHITFMVDNAGSPTLAIDADATASGGNNDMAHVTNDDAGYYTLELTAAQTNYLGGALLSLNVVGTACPVFHEFTILPAQVYDSLVAGSDLLDANASQLGGTSQTGRDVGASVLLSSGTGTGQVKLSSGYVAPNWGDVGNPTTTVGLTGTTIAPTQKVDVETIKTQTVTCAAPVTVLASVGTAATSTAQTGDSYPIVNSGTHGNAALKALIDAIDDYVDTELAAVLAAVDTEIAALITELAKVPKSDGTSSWNATALADIKTQAVAALATDTYAESSGVPADTATLAAKITVLYDALIHELTVAAAAKTFKNAAGTAQWKKVLSDDGTTYTEGDSVAP